MKALMLENGRLALAEIKKPVRGRGEALVRVKEAGICSTDLELLRGYVPGFSGIPGHEFVGMVEDAADASLVGKRVTAEINCACGACDWCRSDLGRHCPERTVMGIVNRAGCFAEYIAVPIENIIVIPDEIPASSAIFIEPLAAALEIFDQVAIGPNASVLLVGDGRLAQLIARVFCAKRLALTVVGKHPLKLGMLPKEFVAGHALDAFTPRQFDIVIEASGSPAGFGLGLSCVKPRGTLVLKSTYAAGFVFNPAPVVVNEITIVGSRCGRLRDAITFLLACRPDLSPLITARYPFSDALQAFEKTRGGRTLKTVLEMR